VVGELAGTHGVKRPGGSALNAGQVGSMRAAQRIAHIYYQNNFTNQQFAKLAQPVVQRFANQIKRIKAGPSDALDCAAIKLEIQHRMSAYAGMVRSLKGVTAALDEARKQWQQIRKTGLKQDHSGFMKAMETRELALAQLGYLEAILTLLKRGSGSRGSHLVTDPAGTLPHPDLGQEWKYIPENLELRKEILSIVYNLENDTFESHTKKPQQRPEAEYWFENTWAQYRQAAIFAKDDTDKPKAYKIYQ
jgi:hypothetical protein